MPLIAILAGDGIGPEVTAEARRVLDTLGLDLTYEEGLVGGAAYKAVGHPLPPETLELARRADAILFGAVGDPDCDALERQFRPEQAILGLRKDLGLFANLRPAKLLPLPAFLTAGGEAGWPDIFDGLRLTEHFLTRDVLVERRAEPLAARARLVDRLKRAVA